MTREEAREQLECIYTEVSTETDREAINMAIEALKEPKQGEWTPCSEKLPEKMGFYLVTDMYGGVYITGFDEKSFGYYDDEGFYNEEDDIIAWMPAPKPYKTNKAE